MGAVVSKAANGLGAVIGNAFAAPFKSVFGASCEDVCSGTWDLTCFIEHLCVSNLIKLVMVFALTYITMMFFYLLFQLGIIQCIARSLCKMGWAACETYWYAVADITCFLWHKLKNTKRVYRGRRRFRDIEGGYSSSEDDNNSKYYERMTRRRKSIREKRKDRIRRSLYPTRHGSKRRYKQLSHRRKTSQVSVHLNGGSARIKNSRQLQVRKRSNFKRR